ncbi:hypothetical protein [Bradyrhizobium sp. CCBAU 53415]|uniref:hypothetical protein n=1 Tax=Bradyrhizobium sp. CCBAU 53415 TaxID=1325119 RepID=UPI002304EAFD|nr:hypothetical protein [Bradyrhizobium sp. CCBAU 53415]
MQKQIAIALWSLAAASVLAFIFAALVSGREFRSSHKRASTATTQISSSLGSGL